jgi:hypothetical protein
VKTWLFNAWKKSQKWIRLEKFSNYGYGFQRAALPMTMMMTKGNISVRSQNGE